MSGPKIDKAELERRKKEELERARLERLRKIKEATSLFISKIENIRKLISEIKNDKTDLIESVLSVEEMSYVIESIREIKQSTIAKLKKIIDIEIDNEPEDINNQIKMLENEKASVMDSYYSVLQSESERINEYKGNVEKQKKYNEFSKVVKTNVSKNTTFKEISFGEKTEKLEKNISYDVYLKEASEICDNENIPENEKESLKEFIRVFEDGTASEKEINKTEFLIYRDRIKRIIEEFNELYLVYVAEQVSLSKIVDKRLIIKNKNQFASLEDLKKEIETIREKAEVEDEQKYIREQIDEVMELFGYNMCKSVIFDARQKGTHYICEEQNGDTAIHIHVSDNKQIMMEIVGLEDVEQNGDLDINATINGSEQLNDYQKQHLLDRQGRFCIIHPRMVDELKKRGVILRTKIHREPSIEFCKKVVRMVNNTKQEHSENSFAKRKEGKYKMQERTME